MIGLSLLGFLVAALAAGGIVRWARGHAAAYGQGMPQRFHFGDVPRLGGAAIALTVAGIAGSFVCVGLISRFFPRSPAPAPLSGKAETSKSAGPEDRA